MQSAKNRAMAHKVTASITVPASQGVRSGWALLMTSLWLVVRYPRSKRSITFDLWED
jgi:hypothetical protein